MESDLPLYLLAGYTAYNSLLALGNMLSARGSEEIKMADLEKILSERNKMGISKGLKIRAKNEGGNTEIYKAPGKLEDYTINLSPKNLKKMHLRHELYHLKDGHLKYPSPNLLSFIPLVIWLKIKYLFHDEPKTMIYCLKSKYGKEKTLEEIK